MDTFPDFWGFLRIFSVQLWIRFRKISLKITFLKNCKILPIYKKWLWARNCQICGFCSNCSFASSNHGPAVAALEFYLTVPRHFRIFGIFGDFFCNFWDFFLTSSGILLNRSVKFTRFWDFLGIFWCFFLWFYGYVSGFLGIFTDFFCPAMDTFPQNFPKNHVFEKL